MYWPPEWWTPWQPPLDGLARAVLAAFPQSPGSTGRPPFRSASPGGHDADRFMLALVHQGAAGPRKGRSPPALTRTCPSMSLLFGLDMRTPASGKEAIVPVRDVPSEPSLEHLKNQARDLQHRVRGGVPDAVAAVREFHPRLAGAAAGSPELARFPLTAAQLVVARQYGFASWARLRRSVAVVIRPVTSPRELARAFELIGARRAPALEQDRYFLQLARRFPDDRPLMLAAELDGQIIGAGLAFRKGSSPECRTATLRNVAVLPPHNGIGLERRLIRRIEEGAASLGVTGIILGGPRGAERQLFLSMGYRGRHEGGFMAKQLPLTVQQRNPGWRQRLEDLRSRQQWRLTAQQRPT
jgi:GNAT superfamily N-acetyltransferase